MRAWTLGLPSAYEKAVRIPGNSKAPGGIVFRSREDALAWREEHGEERYLAHGTTPSAWEPYEIELPCEPGHLDEVISWDRRTVSAAFHSWHQKAVAFDMRCAVCMDDKLEGDLPHVALLVEARFINPDTGELV